MRRYAYLAMGALASGSLLLSWCGTAEAATAPVIKPVRSVRPLDTTPPPAPAGLQTTVDPAARQVTVKWSAVTAPDLAGYLVYRSDTTPVALDPAHLRSTATPFKSLQFFDYPPFTGATYYYVVVAVDTSGNRSASAPLAVTTIDRTPPPAPTGVTGSMDPVAGTYTLSWNAPTDPDTAGYRIAYCSSGFNDPCFVIASDPALPRTQTSLTSPWPAGYKVLYQEVCAEDTHFLRACTQVTVQAPQ
ncbi:fibronectin type III domain-containing protein [Streptomyces polygonati]|uniref:Fibronectin type III domain-containing protein n=1 Tax=Streptomyces polygonati TaxID=1617087 RepID=A0ABV8HUH0_9ACTN